MWVDLGICGPTAFVWEDVVDGSEGDHDEGEGGVGGVEAVGPVDDEPDPSVESFVAGVVDPESHCGEDAVAGRVRIVLAAVTKGLSPLRDALEQNRSRSMAAWSSLRSPGFLSSAQRAPLNLRAASLSGSRRSSWHTWRRTLSNAVVTS